MPDKPPRPRAPSQSELQPAKVDQTVGAAKDYAASQDHVRPELARRGTLPGGMAALPQPPPLPLEHARTVPAAAHVAPTQRAPTPATGIRIPDDETPASGRADASAELAEARAKLAEYERRERVQAESRGPGPYQPPLRSQSPVPSSTPEAKTDRAIGGLVRALLARFGWPALAAIGIGGAALKPTADPAKQDAALIGQEELTRKIDRLGTKLDGVIDREATRDDFLICLYEQQADYFAQLLPSQERLVAAQPLRTWVDRCRNRKPPR